VGLIRGARESNSEAKEAKAAQPGGKGVVIEKFGDASLRFAQTDFETIDACIVTSKERMMSMQLPN
jgi:hypothetical protein